MNKVSITKSNALIEASYRLSRTEMQILLYGISLINPTDKNFPFIYRIDTARFAEMFNRKHGEIYTTSKMLYANDFGSAISATLTKKMKLLLVAG